MKKKYCLAAVVFLLTLQSFAQFIDDLEYPPGSTIGDWWYCDGTPQCFDFPEAMGNAHSGDYFGIIQNGLLNGLILDLGNKIFEDWYLNFYMYVPSNKEAYLNIQGQVPVQGGEWVVGNFFFNQDLAQPGVGLIDDCVGAPVNFNFPHDQWFEVNMGFDISSGIATATWFLEINETTVIPNGTPFTNQSGTVPTSLGGIDFYPLSADTEFYIDTFIYSSAPIPPAQEFADDMEYGAGIPPSSFWWYCEESNGCSIEISQDQANSGSSSGYISDTDATNQILHLGNQMEGNRGLDFYMYIPTGNEAAFELQGNALGAAVESIVGDFVFNDGNSNPGVGYIEDTSLGQIDFTFPHDQWFRVTADFDLGTTINQANWRMYIDGSEVIPASTPFTNSNGDYPDSLGSLNFKAQNNTSGFYIDDLQFDDGFLLNTSENVLSSFLIVPNPSSGSIELRSLQEIIEIKISDITGKSRNLGNATTIDLSDLASGLYYISVTTVDGTQTQKLIKQ